MKREDKKGMEGTKRSTERRKKARQTHYAPGRDSVQGNEEEVGGTGGEDNGKEGLKGRGTVSKRIEENNDKERKGDEWKEK